MKVGSLVGHHKNATKYRPVDIRDVVNDGEILRNKARIFDEQKMLAVVK